NPETASSSTIGWTISRPRRRSESWRCCWTGRERTAPKRCRRTCRRRSGTSRDFRTGSNSGPPHTAVESDGRREGNVECRRAYLYLEVRFVPPRSGDQGLTRSSFTYRTPRPTSPKRICFLTPWASRTARLISGHAPRWPFGTTWTRYFARWVSGSPSYPRKCEPYLKPDLG